MPQEILQDSLEPALRLTLTDDGEPVKLTQATGGVILRGVQYDIPIFEQTVTTGLTDSGIVERDWVAGETETPGRIWVTAGVVWPGGRVQWFEAADVVDVLPR